MSECEKSLKIKYPRKKLHFWKKTFDNFTFIPASGLM